MNNETKTIIVSKNMINCTQLKKIMIVAKVIWIMKDIKRKINYFCLVINDKQLLKRI